MMQENKNTPTKPTRTLDLELQDWRDEELKELELAAMELGRLLLHHPA